MKKTFLAIIIFIAAIVLVIVVATSETVIAPGSDFPAETQQGTESATCAIDEEYYLTSISRTSFTLSRVSEELEGLLIKPEPDNDEWTRKVTAQSAIIREEYEKTIQLTPPDCLLDVNNKFNLGVATLNDMTYLLTEGIDHTDYDLIAEAHLKLKEGAELISKAVDLMNLANEIYGV